MSGPAISINLLRRRLPWRRWLRYGSGAAGALATFGLVISGTAEAMQRAAGYARTPTLVTAPSKVPGKVEYRWAVAPTIVLAFISGSGGGPAGYPVFCKLDIADGGSSTGDSTRWDEGYVEWQVLKSDGSAIDTADRISCLDPVAGHTVRLDTDQHGFNAMYPFLSAGTYKFQCRYWAGSSGLSSGWVTSSTVTITSRSGTNVYVDPAVADDTGDGLSWATAKKFVQSAITVLNAQSAGATLNARGVCTCTASSASITNAGALIVSEDLENPATFSATGNFTITQSSNSTNGLLIHGINFASSSDGNGTVHICVTGATGTGVCFLDCVLGDGLRNFITGQGAAATTGLAAITVTMDDAHDVRDAFCFHEKAVGLVIWGCRSVRGGTAEHTIRLLNTQAGNAYHSIEYSVFGNTTTKHWLRAYGSGPFVAHHCIGYKSTSVGYATEGDNLPGNSGTTYRFDGCIFRSQPPTTDGHGIAIYSDWTGITFSNCVFDEGQISIDDRVNPQPGVSISKDITLVHNTFNKDTLSGNCLSWVSDLINRPTGIRIYNNIFAGTILAANNYRFLLYDLPDPGEGWDIDGNVIVRTAALPTAHDYTTANNYTFAQWQALDQVGANESRRDSLSLNTTTWEPASADTPPTAARRPFLSVNGYRYNQNATTMQAGAWLNPSDAAIYDTRCLFYAGGLIFSVVAVA